MRHKTRSNPTSNPAPVPVLPQIQAVLECNLIGRVFASLGTVDKCAGRPAAIVKIADHGRACGRAMIAARFHAIAGRFWRCKSRLRNNRARRRFRNGRCVRPAGGTVRKTEKQRGDGFPRNCGHKIAPHIVRVRAWPLPDSFFFK